MYLEHKGLRYQPIMLKALNNAQREKIMDLISGRTRIGSASHLSAILYFESINGELRLVKNPFSRLENYRELYYNERTVLNQLRVHEPYLEDHYSSGPTDALATMRLIKILHQAYTSRFSAQDAMVKDHYYNPDSQAFKITVKVIDAFYQGL